MSKYEQLTSVEQKEVCTYCIATMMGGKHDHACKGTFCDFAVEAFNKQKIRDKIATEEPLDGYEADGVDQQERCCQLHSDDTEGSLNTNQYNQCEGSHCDRGKELLDMELESEIEELVQEAKDIKNTGDLNV